MKRILTPSGDATPPRFVDEGKLEAITGIKRRTWQKHRLFNRGPRWYKLHGAVRYDLDEVIAWIKAHPGGGELADGSDTDSISEIAQVRHGR